MNFPLPSAPAPLDHAAGIERPAMYANEPGSQTQCDALNEIIRLRDVKIAQLEKQIANKLQPRIDELEVENKMLRRGMGPIGEKVRT